MGLSVLNQPAAAGGGIKSVQRGSAGGAGNVTITAVDITKAFVNIFGTTSSGTVAASGSINATSGALPKVTGTFPSLINGGFNSTQNAIMGSFNGDPQNETGASGTIIWHTPAQTINYNSTNLTGGSNNLVAAVVQGYLSNSTTLVVSGACRYEVVEFN